MDQCRSWSSYDKMCLYMHANAHVHKHTQTLTEDKIWSAKHLIHIYYSNIKILNNVKNNTCIILQLYVTQGLSLRKKMDIKFPNRWHLRTVHGNSPSPSVLFSLSLIQSLKLKCVELVPWRSASLKGKHWGLTHHIHRNSVTLDKKHITTVNVSISCIQCTVFLFGPLTILLCIRK